MLKVELHTHTADDPVDLIPHPTSALMDRAAALGYDAVAITLHERQLDLAPWQRHAEALGLVLIPGVERTIQGRHVLLLNFPPVAERVESFAELRSLRAKFGGLVVAPHPFYPGRTCLGRDLDPHADLFDAVEWTWCYTATTRRFNEAAARWARAHGKPVVANADVHRLHQLGRTYSLVDADRNAESICVAIREGRVTRVSRPIGALEAASYLASLTAASTVRWVRTLAGVAPGEAGPPISRPPARRGSRPAARPA
jgi:predicted metal-dependent phosphoesterase TrpH